MGAHWAPAASHALSSPLAGAYYPAQGVQQFPAGVPTAQVIVSQQPPIPPKRERKTVRSHAPLAWGRCVLEMGMVPCLAWGTLPVPALFWLPAVLGVQNSS